MGFDNLIGVCGGWNCQVLRERLPQRGGLWLGPRGKHYHKFIILLQKYSLYCKHLKPSGIQQCQLDMHNHQFSSLRILNLLMFIIQCFPHSVEQMNFCVCKLLYDQCSMEYIWKILLNGMQQILTNEPKKRTNVIKRSQLPMLSVRWSCHQKLDHMTEGVPPCSSLKPGVEQKCLQRVKIITTFN